MGRYCFHKCLSVHTRGRGIPNLHPIILQPVPCPFQGGTPVTGPRSLPGGGGTQARSRWGRVPWPGPDVGVRWPGPDGEYWGQVQTGGTPATSRWGQYPRQVQMRAPWPGMGVPRDGLARDGVHPHPETGYPHLEMGYTPPPPLG